MRRAVRVRDDAVVQVSVRVPGWLKNRVVAVAAGEGLTLNRWAAGVLLRAVESGEGFPPAPPARVGVPSPDDVLRGYLSGEDVVEPCGRVSPCERVTAGVDVVDGMEFCRHCRVRVV